ncbi:DUF1272 domain-containing protein [Marinomonas sp. C2222]|uniref:DUF1272 domain-containing protein n=1 Tax=Marinomonas sargassi TaxID=2984494 RepID=A0ABT2YPY7_9GAMM|nr:DUF1272 domain-containing protein [Marinomonas sargassi]MCV2401963.1 DUF1272 domain-containing protein [Marinomonas sargassi]
MLAIKPNCEYCQKTLPADAQDAMICSYECTFCSDCVKSVLRNVCPNCGGGFSARPIRPKHDRRQGVSLAYHPASTTEVHTKYSLEEITAFSEAIKNIAPKDR